MLSRWLSPLYHFGYFQCEVCEVRQSVRVLSRVSRADWFAPSSLSTAPAARIDNHFYLPFISDDFRRAIVLPRDPDVVRSINQFLAVALACDRYKRRSVTSRAPTSHVTGKYISDAVNSLKIQSFNFKTDTSADYRSLTRLLRVFGASYIVNS